MYEVLFSKRAIKDRELLKSAGLSEKARALCKILAEDPFRNPPPYEKLVGDLSGSYSRRINVQHRLVYEVDKEKHIVYVLRMWSHYEWGHERALDHCDQMKNASNYSAQEGTIISLEDFLSGINDRTSGKGIKQIDFYLRNYPHYHSCSIGRYIDKFNINGELNLKIFALPVFWRKTMQKIVVLAIWLEMSIFFGLAVQAKEAFLKFGRTLS